MPDDPLEKIKDSVSRLELTIYGDQYKRKQFPGLESEVERIRLYISEERADREVLKNALAAEQKARLNEEKERELEAAKREGVTSVFSTLVWFIRLVGVGGLVGALAWAYRFLMGGGS